MVRLLLVVLAAIVLAGGARAATPPAMRLWVEVDHPGPIHPQEMVILRVHGRFMVPITLEKLQDPPLEGFRAIRIDRDRWTDVFEDGLTQRAFERVVAVFPQRSGRLVVPPFVHHLTVLDARMKQVKTDLASAPVTLDVVPAPGPADGWWLAAADLRLRQAWSRDPGTLDIGQSTRLTLTMEADGVFDDQLPPPPEIRAPGLIVFPGTATRVTRIGLGRAEEHIPLREQALRRKQRLDEVATAFLGPLATVSYTYDIRPATSSPVEIPAIEIPWYDTTSRSLRMAVLPGRTVALRQSVTDTGRLEAALGIAPDAMPPASGAGPGWIAPAAVTALTFGCGWFTFWATLSRRDLMARFDRLRAAGRRRRLLRTVRTAAKRGDPVATRTALLALATSDDPGLSRRAAAAAEVIDRHLFAARVDRPADLVGLTARLA